MIRSELVLVCVMSVLGNWSHNNMFFFSFVASCTYHSLVEILCGHRLSRTIFDVL